MEGANVILSELRDLKAQVSTLSREVAVLDTKHDMATTERRDVKALVNNLGSVISRVEIGLQGSLEAIERVDVRTQREVAHLQKHVDTHCTELDILKLAIARGKGMISGASLVGGLAATVMGALMAGAWTLAQNFGWFGLGGHK